MATQKGIAKELGISQAIVSRVLSGDTKSVSKETASKIIDAARSMNYNKRKQSQSRYIGVIVSESSQRDSGYSYERRFLLGVQEQARRLNAIPIQHILTDGEGFAELSGKVSGWISGSVLPAAQLRRLQIPMVFAQCRELSGSYDSIMEDSSGIVGQTLRHLHGLGHRRFGYFDVRPNGLLQARRYGAFHETLAALDLPAPAPEWIFTPHRQERSLDEVERQVRDFLSVLKGMSARPSALFIAGDIYALPFLRLAKEYGFSIPGDFSVFGYDDIPDAELAGLSSIAQPLEDIGREAVSRLLARIDDPELPVRDIAVPMRFNVRASIGPVKGEGRRK